MRSLSRKNATIVGAVTLCLSFPAALSQSASAGLSDTTFQSSAEPHPVQRLCAVPKSPQTMACFALRRTDSLHQKVGGGVLPSGYGPADLASAYRLSRSGGGGATVAIVDAYDDPTAESDLATYRSTYGLSACTSGNGCFTKVNQNGVEGNYPPADPGWAGEISLDLDMVSAVCPTCHILLVEANSASIANLGTSVNTAVALGARYVSNSYGGSESPGETGYDASYYHHNGVVVTASTGDSGYGTSYPSVSPYVTAVGGTSLHPSGGPRGWSETAWSGAGSGCSSYEAKPSWQNVDTGCSRRAVADVSAVADPNTGVAVYQTYGGTGWAVYGGTSVSAPIIAGVYALAGVPGTSDTPASYPYAHPGSLWDVVSGSNGSCSTTSWCHAGSGWDGPTGLGTPNGTRAFTNVSRIGVLSTTGTASVNEGPLGAPFTNESNNVQQVALAGNRIGVLLTNGDFYVKEGDLNASWVLESSTVSQIALSGNRIGALHTDGSFYVKEGALNAGWVLESSTVSQIALSGNRIGALHTDGSFYVKAGALNASWVFESSTVSGIALSGNRIGALHTDGSFYVKEGTLNASWVLESSTVSGIALSGNRIGALHTNGSFYVKAGALNASWVLESSTVSRIALSGNRIGIVRTNGNVYVKQGALNAGWNLEASGGAEVVLSGPVSP